MARALSMEVPELDKINLKDQVGGVKNRVTLIKVDGTENTYDVYADRTGVTQVGDEITAAALMQIQDNAEQAIGDVTGYDRVIPYAEGTQTTAKVISAPVEPAAERTAGLCVRVKMPAAFDETCLLYTSPILWRRPQRRNQRRRKPGMSWKEWSCYDTDRGKLFFAGSAAGIYGSLPVQGV